MNPLPGWIWVAEIATLAALIAATCAALYAGARTRIAVGAGIVLGGWLLVSAYLAGAGVYRPATEGAPTTVPVVLVAALAVGLLLTRIPAVRAALAGPDALVRITAVQTFRVVGGVFLVVMALGALPPVFALPAGIGDIAVGIAAPFVARRIAADPRRRPGALGFHLLGMLDLAVALTIGAAAAPGPLNVLHVTPSTEQLAVLPLALVPTVAVPLALVLHVAALRELRRARTAAVPAPAG